MMGVKPSSCKLVLLCLADCHNSDNGRCDPSVAFISEFTGLDRKTIPESLDTLEALGLISQAKRPGHSTLYTLQIADHPAPVREKGARKKVVKFDRPKQLDLPRKRATPISGYPENGLPRNRTSTLPENGLPPSPKTGYEPTKNLPDRTYQLPVAAATAAVAAFPVDNFSLMELGVIYGSDNPEAEILKHGSRMLMRSGVDQHSARHFLQKLINDHGAGLVLDALVTCLIDQPIEPKSYLRAVLAKQGSEISKDWSPPAQCLAELAALGIPENIYRDARDVFVIWFRDHGIRHNNFPALFVRWCQRDWERAEGNRVAYLQRLRAAAGYQEEFREPA